MHCWVKGTVPCDCAVVRPVCALCFCHSLEKLLTEYFSSSLVFFWLCAKNQRHTFPNIVLAHRLSTIFLHTFAAYLHLNICTFVHLWYTVPRVLSSKWRGYASVPRPKGPLKRCCCLSCHPANPHLETSTSAISSINECHNNKLHDCTACYPE